MFCNRFNGDEFSGLPLMLRNGELEAMGPLDILKKLSGCFWCGDIFGIRDGWKAEVGTVGGDGRRLGDIARRGCGEWRRSRRSRLGSWSACCARSNCCVIARVSPNRRNCWRTRGSSSGLQMLHRSRVLPCDSCNNYTTINNTSISKTSLLIEWVVVEGKMRGAIDTARRSYTRCTTIGGGIVRIYLYKLIERAIRAVWEVNNVHCLRFSLEDRRIIRERGDRHIKCVYFMMATYKNTPVKRIDVFV